MLSNRALLKTEKSERRVIFNSQLSSVHNYCEGKASVDTNKTTSLNLGRPLGGGMSTISL